LRQASKKAHQKFMQPKGERKDWKELARRAANEHDSEKLLALIEELNFLLSKRTNCAADFPQSRANLLRRNEKLVEACFS